MASALISPSLIRTPPLKSPHLSISKRRSPTPLFLPLTQPTTPPAKLSHKTAKFWRISAAAEDALPSVPPMETTQQTVNAVSSDEGVSTLVSALLFIAFVGLSLLTIGIVYLAVQDFLQKRETEKFEKGESAKKKKGGKKTKAPARTGPRGFGQKLDEEEEDD